MYRDPDDSCVAEGLVRFDGVQIVKAVIGEMCVFRAMGAGRRRPRNARSVMNAGALRAGDWKAAGAHELQRGGGFAGVLSPHDGEAVRRRRPPTFGFMSCVDRGVGPPDVGVS